MPRTVVISGSAFPASQIRCLQQAGFKTRVIPGDLTSDGVLVELKQDAWGYILGGSERMTMSTWEEVPDLRAVCFMGTGWQSFIELPDAKSPINFCYTPHANAEAVAEFALGLLIDSVRQIAARSIGVRQGKWTEETTPSLLGSTLGIVGMGHVGRSLARMFSSAFAGTVVYWNRSERPENTDLPYERLSTIRAVCEQADNVAICMAYVAGETDNLLGLDELCAIGLGTLVNAARPELVDPLVLRDALTSRGLGSAAIDGYYIEPTPKADEDPHGLLALSPEKLLVTPHCAYLGAHAVMQMASMAVENLIAIADGMTAPHGISR